MMQTISVYTVHNMLLNVQNLTLWVKETISEEGSISFTRKYCVRKREKWEKSKKRDWACLCDFLFFVHSRQSSAASLWGPTLKKSPPDCGVAGQQGSPSMLSAVFPQNWRGLRPWSHCVTLSCYILCHAAQGAAASFRLLVSPALQSQPRHQAEHEKEVNGLKNTTNKDNAW